MVGGALPSVVVIVFAVGPFSMIQQHSAIKSTTEIQSSVIRFGGVGASSNFCFEF